MCFKRTLAATSEAVTQYCESSRQLRPSSVLSHANAKLTMSPMSQTGGFGCLRRVCNPLEVNGFRSCRKIQPGRKRQYSETDY